MKPCILQILIFCHFLTGLSFLYGEEAQPTNLTELEEVTLELAETCREATVGMTIGNAQGTGVIVTPDGLLVTAFHCIQNVGREFEIILADGRRAKAIAAYGDKNLDIALAIILDEPPVDGWPFRPVKMDGDLKKGDWCVSFGNSAGIQSNRPAPMRLGRVLGTHKWQGNQQLLTDVTMVSGDSGGPLFDIEGKVAGVNSNVGAETAIANHHARIGEVVELWEDTLKGEKPLPDIASLRKNDEKFAIERSKPKGLSKAQREQTSSLLKKQYGEDFPDEVIDIILKASKINAKTGAVEIKVSPDVVKQIVKAGHDPAKIGLITEQQAKEMNAAGGGGDTKEKSNSKGLSDVQREQTSALLKKQFGEGFPDEVIDIILKASKINAETNGVEIKVSPAVIKQIVKAGHDPVKIGLITEQQAKEFKVAGKKANSDGGSSNQEEKIEQALRKQFSGREISDEAMKVLLSAGNFDKENGKLELKLTQDHVARLKEAGFELNSGDQTSTKGVIVKALEKKLGKKLSDEAREILLSVSKFDMKTSELKIDLSTETHNKLVELGVDLNKLGYTPKTKLNYKKLASEFGDSATDITQSFPEINPVVAVLLEDKQIAFATAVKSDGYLVTKASEIGDVESVQISMGGVKKEASVIARDEISDLALLKTDAELKVPEWSDARLPLGSLLLSPASDRTMLGVVSNLPREILSKLVGAGNGNQAILGIRSLGKAVPDAVDGVLVEEANGQFPAGKAGIKKGDLITKWNGEKVITMSELTNRVGQCAPGDEVEISVMRDDKAMMFKVVLEDASNSELFAMDATSSSAQKISQKSGELSERRRNFPTCITHDALIWADDCGGPLYDRSGNVVGINIARYDRTACYALTQSSFESALERLLAAGQ